MPDEVRQARAVARVVPATTLCAVTCLTGATPDLVVAAGDSFGQPQSRPGRRPAGRGPTRHVHPRPKADARDDRRALDAPVRAHRLRGGRARQPGLLLPVAPAAAAVRQSRDGETLQWAGSRRRAGHRPEEFRRPDPPAAAVDRASTSRWPRSARSTPSVVPTARHTVATSSRSSTATTGEPQSPGLRHHGGAWSIVYRDRNLVTPAARGTCTRSADRPQFMVGSSGKVAT